MSHDGHQDYGADDAGNVNICCVGSSLNIYRQNVPAAKIALKDCTVSSSSKIRLPKSYMCDEDNLIIDGQECAIMSLTSASGGSL